jgi:hypothetical protein
MEPKVNEKNTKSEILKAYEELMINVVQQKKEEPRKQQEEVKKQEVVKVVSSLSHESIVKGFATLKIDLASTLEKLEEKLMTEFKHFEELQQAVTIEKENLENLYQITANADSLAALLMAQKVKREEFEATLSAKRLAFEQQLDTDKQQLDAEMQQKRELWKKEKAVAELQVKEDAEALKKKREREEEEYAYNLQLLRKKDADIYQEHKLKLEKELADKKTSFDADIAAREAKVTEAEAELKLLRQKTEAFPAELEKAVASAVKAVTEKQQAEYGFAKELTAKQMEGEMKLKEQTIETLQAKIKDLENNIKELSIKANTAEASVKDIAIKAIESSAKLQLVEKAKEA